MSRLDPTLSSALADTVYALTRRENLTDAITSVKDRFQEILTVSDTSLLKGKTGGPGFVKCRTAFGFVLMGKGRFEGHAFFLFRGTQYAADWLTNLNAGVSRSPSGFSIHDGFHMAFKSMKPQLSEYMAEISKKKINHIHCIGHSLGGGIATICADWIRASYKRKPYLYTYGSPRVGTEPFAAHLTQQLGGERVFRVYHSTDVVPCLPTWPYSHVPFQAKDYWIYSPGIFPSAEYHAANLYVDSVTGKSWSALSNLKHEHQSEFSILRWLRSQTIASFTTNTLNWLNGALTYVLEKCFNGAKWIISTSFNTTFTLVDKLAFILSRPDIVIGKVSELVMLLVTKMLQAIGMFHKVKKEQLNREFIRFVFLRLQQKMNDHAKAALGKVLVDGRQI